MAYGNKYTLTFADAQNREHVAYLDLDGYGGGVTALTPGENPLIWGAGANRGDAFATLMPSSVELNMIVENSTLFSDIAGDAEFAWMLRWEIAGDEVWRGFVLTDELTQPLDIPGQLTVRAVCGLVTLENIEWTPASGARQTMMPLVADALGDLGLGLSIRSLANWHAGATPGAPPSTSTAVSGNSYARYEIMPTNYRNSDGTTYASCAMVLSNLAGLFLSTLVQADGKWTLVQREAITGASYTTSVYDSAGAYSTTEAVTQLQIDTASQILLYGGQLSAARAYSGAETRYSHGDLGFQVFDNSSFQTWSGGVPTSWTEIDENTVTVPNTGNILAQVETGFTQGTNALGQSWREATFYGAKVYGATAYGGSGEPKDYAKTGLMQNGQVTTASGSTIELGFSVRTDTYAVASLGPRPVYWSLWLNTGGTDYYWSDQGQAWTAGTLPTHTAGGVTETVAIAAKNPIYVPVDPGFKSYVFAVGATPADGVLRIVLYNAVGLFVGDASLTATYDEVSVKISGDSDYLNGTARTTVTDAATPGRAIYDTGTYLSGQGPTIYHKRAITFSSGTAAQNWKPTVYTNGQTLSGETLERVRCEQALKALGAPPKRLRAGFEMTSGTYWPHNGLLLDSVEYTCSSLSHSARFCQYEGEWIEQKVHSYTPTEEVLVIDAWLDPLMDDLFDSSNGNGDPTEYGPGNPYVPPDPGSGGWSKPDNPTAEPRAASFGASLAQSLTIGPNPNPTERLVISSDVDDTAIRFDTTVGGTGVYIVGIDTSDSNKFKITEGIELGTTPTSGVGDRVVIDGDGNIVINEDFGGTTYNFILDGQNTDYGGGTYNDSGILKFRGHRTTLGTDQYDDAEIQLIKSAVTTGSGHLRLKYADAELSIGAASSNNGFLTFEPSSSASIGFRLTADSAVGAVSPSMFFTGYYSAGPSARSGAIFYDNPSADLWSLKLIAYSDDGTTAGETLEVKSGGGVKWGGMSFPAAIPANLGSLLYYSAAGVVSWMTDTPSNGQFLRWNTGGSITWETVAGGVTALDDLSDVVITAAATGDILRFNGTNWVDYADSNYAAASHSHALDDLSDVVITAAATGDLLRFNGTNWVDYADSNYATSGHNHSGVYQPLDADLTTIAGLSSADSNFIVGSAGGWVVESGATARASLGVDAAGTDNSTNVTLAGTYTYITISGQQITRGAIDLASHVTLTGLSPNDLLYGAALTGLARLANGTTGQYLAATTGSAPSWAAISVAAANVSAGSFGSGNFTFTGHVYNATNNTYDLGASGVRWRAIYGVDANLSGNIDVGDGSSTAPSYTFASETGLGIYRNGAGSLAVTVGSAGPAFVFNASEFYGLSLTSSLGTSGSRWATIYGANGNFSTSLVVNSNAVYYATGTDVPVTDGGTGASTLTGLLQGNGTSAITGITNSSTVGQVLRVTGASTYAWGALDLADTDAVTGTLAQARLPSTVPQIFNGAYGGAPGALGQKAGDIALDSDVGGIYIANYTASWVQVN